MTRILLVEDEENYRVPLAFSLRRDGFDVVQAADGVEAVEVFEAAGPSGGGSIDLVLLDLMLPRLSGIEVCRRIRRASTVPVIMLTARDSEADTVVGLRIGADDYVTKPYSYRELLARAHRREAVALAYQAIVARACGGDGTVGPATDAVEDPTALRRDREGADR